MKKSAKCVYRSFLFRLQSLREATGKLQLCLAADPSSDEIRRTSRAAPAKKMSQLGRKVAAKSAYTKAELYEVREFCLIGICR